jgi:hypothetical protein
MPGSSIGREPHDEELSLDTCEVLVAAILVALTLPPYRGLPVPLGMRIRRADSRRQNHQASLSLRRIGRSVKAERCTRPSRVWMNRYPFRLPWTPVAPYVQLSRG